jgi:hypothetical protein
MTLTRVWDVLFCVVSTWSSRDGTATVVRGAELESVVSSPADRD